jgi:hypothetical protein
MQKPSSIHNKRHPERWVRHTDREREREPPAIKAKRWPLFQLRTQTECSRSREKNNHHDKRERAALLFLLMERKNRSPLIDLSEWDACSGVAFIKFFLETAAPLYNEHLGCKRIAQNTLQPPSLSLVQKNRTQTNLWLGRNAHCPLREEKRERGSRKNLPSVQVISF